MDKRMKSRGLAPKGRDTANTERVQRIDHVLRFYMVEEIKDPFDVSNGKLDLGWLIADVMHYCDARGIAFDEALKLAHSHYDEERQA